MKSHWSLFRAETFSISYSPILLGVPVKLLIYEDDVHAIDRPKSEADHWLQIGEWLHRHLQ